MIGSQSRESPHGECKCGQDGERRGRSQYRFWTLWFCTVLATSTLFVGLDRGLLANRKGCWDTFNYYCKRPSAESAVHLSIDNTIGLLDGYL